MFLVSRLAEQTRKIVSPTSSLKFKLAPVKPNELAIAILVKSNYFHISVSLILNTYTPKNSERKIEQNVLGDTPALLTT